MCDKIHYDELEERVTSLESKVMQLCQSMTSGFSAVNANIETLSQQITNMDKRIIEEKVKWGDVFRSIVKWAVRALLSIAVYAAGINVTKSIFPMLFN